jgi:hypothetical protein
MNWRLILSLSQFGVAMGVASVLGLAQGYGGILWSLIGIFCAIWIARKLRTRHFVHGLLTGAIGGGIAPLIQVPFFSTYLTNNPRAVADLKQLPAGLSVQTFFLILILVIAVLSGLALGLLSWAAGKIIKHLG